MKHANNLFVLFVFIFSTCFLEAVAILNEDLYHIEYSDGKGRCYSRSIINKELKERIDTIVKKIETSKTLNEKYREIISLNLATQLSVELELLKSMLTEGLKDCQQLIKSYR